MTSRARHEKSAGGKTLLQMLNDELDDAVVDNDEGFDEYHAGVRWGYVSGLAFAIATITDPYQTKDRYGLMREIIQESEDRIVVKDA